ncbi:twin-arginine translocase subunit TatC [Cellulomonas marina]|nr:twin-arginine translocase subunit TatC [Cellulomonas marina]
MPLRAHLRELRRRVVLAALGLVVGAVVGWFLYEPVIQLLSAPLNQAAEARGGLVILNYAGVATSVDVAVKVSLFLGVLLSSPWWIYQLWAFVTPGLTRTEKRYAIGFVAAAVPLFLAGAATAAWALPNAVRILTDFTPDGAGNVIDAQLYLSFVMRLILAFGLAFLLPVVLTGLNLANLLQGRSMLKGWRWAIMLAFTFSAVMTPTPDAITMIVLALPICGLYFAAVGLALLHDRRVDRRRLAEGLPRLDGTVPDEVPAGR